MVAIEDETRAAIQEAFTGTARFGDGTRKGVMATPSATFGVGYVSFSSNSWWMVDVTFSRVYGPFDDIKARAFADSQTAEAINGKWVVFPLVPVPDK